MASKNKQKSNYLDNLINYYLANSDSFHTLTPDDKKMLADAFRDNVTKEVIHEKALQIVDERAKVELQQKEKELHSFLRNSVVIAFLIGMLVNQSTNIITRFEDLIENFFQGSFLYPVIHAKFIVPIILVLLSARLIFIVIRNEYIANMLKLIKEHFSK